VKLRLDRGGRFGRPRCGLIPAEEVDHVRGGKNIETGEVSCGGDDGPLLEHLSENRKYVIEHCKFS